MRTHWSYLLVLLMWIGMRSAGSAQDLEDGLYRIPAFALDSNWTGSTPQGTTSLPFHSLFEEEEGGPAYFLIDTMDHVPLRLEIAPRAEDQSEGKKRLMLTLTKEGSEKLRSFTADRVGETVAIVIDDQVVSKHVVKEALTSGQLQIAWCGPDACEQLRSRLQDNVR